MSIELERKACCNCGMLRGIAIFEMFFEQEGRDWVCFRMRPFPLLSACRQRVSTRRPQEKSVYPVRSGHPAKCARKSSRWAAQDADAL